MSLSAFCVRLRGKEIPTVLQLPARLQLQQIRAVSQ